MSRKIFLGPINRLWWFPLLSGLVCIGLGIWTLLSPIASLPVLAYIFAGCLCVAGVVELLFSSLMSRNNSHWGWSMVIGMLDIVAGVWMFLLPTPELTLTFMLIIGIWILCVAINSVAEACVLTSYSPGWLLLMMLMLCATIILAVMFLSNPVVGGVAVWLWLGISLITYGVYRLILARQVRSVTREFGGMK